MSCTSQNHCSHARTQPKLSEVNSLALQLCTIHYLVSKCTGYSWLYRGCTQISQHSLRQCLPSAFHAVQHLIAVLWQLHIVKICLSRQCKNSNDMQDLVNPSQIFWHGKQYGARVCALLADGYCDFDMSCSQMWGQPSAGNVFISMQDCLTQWLRIL